MKDEIILFETKDRSITLPVQVTADTVWLNRSQLAELFGRDIKTIGKHIGNAVDFHGTAKADGSYDGAYYVTGNACAEIPFRCLLPQNTVNLAADGVFLQAVRR